MSVSRRDVEHIAALAQLRLSADELSRFERELNDILTHVDALAAAETEEDATPWAEGGAAPQREPGAVGPDPLVRPPSSLAPDWRDGLFAVPRLEALGAQPGPVAAPGDADEPGSETGE